jgi:hypothetical protein
VSTSLSPDEIRATAEIHREISPEYQDAVIDSFIERVGRESTPGSTAGSPHSSVSGTSTAPTR